jgi:ABC-type uncharacterized transport system ATPase subunit
MLCDRVGILRRGDMILSGAVADLLHAQDIVEIALTDDQSAATVVAQLDMAEQVIETQGNLLRITGKAQVEVLAKLVNAGISIVTLNPVTQTLEDVYVQTTLAADERGRVSTPGSQELSTGARGQRDHS